MIASRGSGAADNGTQRMILASDSPGAVGVGATTDAPLAGDTEEGATSRTGISLWKRIANQLIAIKGYFSTTGVKILPADVTSLKAVTEASGSAILAATQTDVLALSAPIALTASVTLATMLGTALNASLKKLTLISSDPTKIVYWAKGGAASAATAVLLPVGAASVELRCSKTAADTLQFFAPVAVNITILQEG